MITAKNYASASYEGLKTYSTVMTKQKLYHDADAAAGLAENILDSTHFAVPDGGEIFGRWGESLWDRELHLPYDMTAIEMYDNRFQPGDKHVFLYQLIQVDEDGGFMSGDMALNEIVNGAITHRHTNPIEFGTYIFCVGTHEVPGEDFKNDRGKGQIWVPDPFGTILACKPYMVKKEGRDDLERKMFEVRLFPGIESKIGEEGMQGIRDQEGVMVVAILFEFLEALYCQNVTEEVCHKGRPAKIKKGKIAKKPLLETKTLSVCLPGERKIYRDAGGRIVRESPRWHMRRGHPRFYKSGLSIWIDQMSVGNPKRGRIEKNYRVEENEFTEEPVDD